VTRSDALNLEVISKAIDQHDAKCGQPAIEIAMNPYEVDRLGWDEVRGLPIVGDDKIGTGRFEVRCERDKTPAPTVHESAREKVPAGGVE
jgi:hypothetical protein